MRRFLFVGLILIALIVSACGGAATPTAAPAAVQPTATPVPAEPTVAPEPTQAPEPISYTHLDVYKRQPLYHRQLGLE